jgi:rare lipoprotein A (peptidoglycan hydrolase)
MFSRSKRMTRFVPAFAGVAAMSVASSLFVVGTSSKGDADEQQQAQPVVASRAADETATRGAARTEAGDVTTTSTSTTAAPTTTTVVPTTTTTAAPKPTRSESGVASYYAQPWSKKGCAHKTIAKGTTLTVTNVATGKSATCVVNDRGPFIAGRIVDLDTTIFRQLASPSAGVFRARITW